MDSTNDDIAVARLFHELTKHSYTSVRSAGHSLDWDNKPLPYKVYPEAPELALPRDLVLAPMATVRALQSPAALSAMGTLTIETLSRLLLCAGGLMRRRRVGAQDYHFRAAASAGALYPTEIYVAAADVKDLAPGLYHFSPADLKLRQLRGGDWRATLAAAAGAREPLADAAAVLVLTSIFWRSAWKYRARCYRYCFWDAGTILANLLAAAAAEALPAELVTAFDDRATENLLGIDGEDEGVVCLATIGKAISPAIASAAVTPIAFESVPLSAEQRNYPELIRLHRASKLPSGEQARALAGASSLKLIATAQISTPIEIPELDPDSGLALGETILRRGSSRAFARQPLPQAELGTILASLRARAPADFPPLNEIYLIVNAVEGLEAGAYYFDRHEGLQLLKVGEFRAQAGYLCLEQALGADCSVLVTFMADLEITLGALGNRGYRDAHLEAGILAGRAYLAAYALGRGASGLTFYDDDTSKFFSPHAAGKSPTLMVALGVPARRSE